MAVSDNNVRIRATIPKTLKSVLDEIAARRGISVSAVAAEAIIACYGDHNGEETAVSVASKKPNQNKTLPIKLER